MVKYITKIVPIIGMAVKKDGWWVWALNKKIDINIKVNPVIE